MSSSECLGIPVTSDSLPVTCHSLLATRYSLVMFKKFSIQSKIVFPYTLLFAAVIAVTALITIRIVYRRMDERIEGQMERMAAAISNMGFLLSDDFLSSIRISEVVGADIIAYEHDGKVRATTLNRDRVQEAMALIKSAEVEELLSQSDDMSLIRDIRYLDEPRKVIYRRLKASDEGEQRAKSEEQRAKGEEQRAKSEEQEEEPCALSPTLYALPGL